MGDSEQERLGMLMQSIDDLYKEVMAKPVGYDREECDSCRLRARWAVLYNGHPKRHACDAHLLESLERGAMVKVAPLPDPVGIEAMTEAVNVD